MSQTANFDEQELAKFGALAHRWWDPESEFRPLHEINPLRLGWIAGRCRLSGILALDVGCGGGILTESLAASGARATGIDLSERALSVAKLHALESGGAVAYELCSAEDMAESHPEAFDVVTCMEMLEHVPDPASIVRSCARLVRPGGSVFFSTISRNPKAYAFAILGAEYLLKLLPRGTHDYTKFIKPSELAGLCRNAGLEVQDMTGMGYNPLSRTYSLGRDTSVNYLLHTVKT